MNSKKIRNLLSKKHDEFIRSIEDRAVREAVRKNSFITGGAITSMLLDEDINDYDYYFTDKETVKLVAQYYVNEFNLIHRTNVEVIEEDDKISVYVRNTGTAGAPEGHEVDIWQLNMYDGSQYAEEYDPVFLSTNAISLKGGVQLVLRFYGDPDVIHENYDFVHTKNYWLPTTNELILNSKAIESVLTKELIYTGSKFPVASLFRTRKFINRGWTINAGQYLKIALQISQLDLMDINVLEEQLTGVDAAYFQEILNDVKNAQLNDSNFVVTNEFLIETIDKVFN